MIRLQFSKLGVGCPDDIERSIWFHQNTRGQSSVDRSTPIVCSSVSVDWSFGTDRTCQNINLYLFVDFEYGSVCIYSILIITLGKSTSFFLLDMSEFNMFPYLFKPSTSKHVNRYECIFQKIRYIYSTTLPLFITILV